MVKIGIVGAGRIASRFIMEAKYVSGVEIAGVFGIYEEELKAFAHANHMQSCTIDYNIMLGWVDAVYIASPHLTHYEYARQALEHGKHVLCEKPLTLSKQEAEELFGLAKKKGLVLLEAIKTAFSPGFPELVRISSSGLIGDIKNVDATFTKLVSGNLRELQRENAGGSMTELSTYPLLAAIKLLGTSFDEVSFVSYFDEGRGIDLFTRITLNYKNAVFTGKVGLGVKSEGEMIISGTKGFICVPAPWWKTKVFEARFEDPSLAQSFSFPFEGDGLRYELEEFISLIADRKTSSEKLTVIDSVTIITVIECFLKGEHIIHIR